LIELIGLIDLDWMLNEYSTDSCQRFRAQSLQKRIWDATRLLAEHPHAGRPGRIPATRELVITDTPFIIPYRVVEDTVHILRVLHGKRKWPEHLPKEGE